MISYKLLKVFSTFWEMSYDFLIKVYIYLCSILFEDFRQGLQILPAPNHFTHMKKPNQNRLNVFKMELVKCPYNYVKF